MRKDFDFAHYLGACMAQTLGRVFTFRLSTMLLFAFLLFVWRLVFTFDEAAVQLLSMFFPISIFVTLLILRRHFSNVENFLVPVVEMPELIFFQVD